MNERKPLVAVVGSAHVNAEVARMAEALGERLVSAGFRIVTGGLTGVMAHVARGARRSAAWTGSEVIGVLPGWHDNEGNLWNDIVLRSDLGHYRNVFLVSVADAVVGVAGGAGTLSELALAWQKRCPIVLLAPSGGWSAELTARPIDDRQPCAAPSFESPEAVVSHLERAFPTGCFSSRAPVSWYHGCVPCVHRVHLESAPPPPTTAHGIQLLLGFSVGAAALERRLAAEIPGLLAARMASGREQRLLVTFDDGYRDVLLLRDFFAARPELQPVLFLTVSSFEAEGGPLWFDAFYEALARSVRCGRSVEDALRIAHGPMRAELRGLSHCEAVARIARWGAEQGCHPTEAQETPYLTTREVQELVATGWMVAAHGCYHHDLTRLDDGRLRNELERSAAFIDVLGGTPWLAYPDGRWDERVRQAAVGTGFDLLFTIDPGPPSGERQVNRALVLGPEGDRLATAL